MIPEAVLKELSNILGQAYLSINGNALLECASDATKLSFVPEAVAFPNTAEQVSNILKLATREGFPVIPRGGGSGMSGGALPVQGGLVLSLSRFDRILAIDEDNLICRVEPGVITSHLKQAVENLGLFYPPDPQSFLSCTIGGTVAENSGGPLCIKYGVTKQYVLGLEVVLPDGYVLNIGYVQLLMVEQVNQYGGIFVRHTVNNRGYLPGSAEVFVLKNPDSNAGISNINS